jgi:hypothetical protein
MNGQREGAVGIAVQQALQKRCDMSQIVTGLYGRGSDRAKESSTMTSITINSPNGSKISVQTGLFIDNQFVPSQDSQEFITSVTRSSSLLLSFFSSVVNPCTEEKLCDVVSGQTQSFSTAIQPTHLYHQHRQKIST